MLTRPLAQENITASGNHRPERAKEESLKGQVIAIGADEMIGVKPDDKILSAKYDGSEFKIEGVDCLLLEANGILTRLN